MKKLCPRSFARTVVGARGMKEVLEYFKCTLVDFKSLQPGLFRRSYRHVFEVIHRCSTTGFDFDSGFLNSQFGHGRVRLKGLGKWRCDGGNVCLDFWFAFWFNPFRCPFRAPFPKVVPASPVKERSV